MNFKSKAIKSACFASAILFMVGTAVATTNPISHSEQSTDQGKVQGGVNLFSYVQLKDVYIASPELKTAKELSEFFPQREAFMTIYIKALKTGIPPMNALVEVFTSPIMHSFIKEVEARTVTIDTLQAEAVYSDTAERP